MNDSVNIEATLKNESIDVLMLISAFGEPPYHHQARNEMKNRLIYCDEEFGDNFETNLDLIF